MTVRDLRAALELHLRRAYPRALVVTHRGRRGHVAGIDVTSYADAMLIVLFEDGGTGILRPTEIEVAP